VHCTAIAWARCGCEVLLQLQPNHSNQQVLFYIGDKWSLAVSSNPGRHATVVVSKRNLSPVAFYFGDKWSLAVSSYLGWQCNLVVSECDYVQPPPPR
jgi:hypothetical protein